MKRIIFLVWILLLLASFIGTGELRTDKSGGWCMHYSNFMVCNQSSTDYVLGAR